MQVNPLPTDFNADNNLLYSKINKGLINKVDKLEMIVQNLAERITDLSNSIDGIRFILDGDERK
jgi:hypothetical protein